MRGFLHSGSLVSSQRLGYQVQGKAQWNAIFIRLIILHDIASLAQEIARFFEILPLILQVGAVGIDKAFASARAWQGDFTLHTRKSSADRCLG